MRNCLMLMLELWVQIPNLLCYFLATWRCLTSMNFFVHSSKMELRSTSWGWYVGGDGWSLGPGSHLLVHSIVKTSHRGLREGVAWGCAPFHTPENPRWPPAWLGYCICLKILTFTNPFSLNFSVIVILDFHCVYSLYMVLFHKNILKIRFIFIYMCIWALLEARSGH